MTNPKTDPLLAFHSDALVPWQTLSLWLSLGRHAIRKLISEGLPVVRVNQRVLRFRKSEVEAWLLEKRA